MTFLKSWEEFEKAAERLYLQDPMKVRYRMKYTHGEGSLSVKITDDIVEREIACDLPEIEVRCSHREPKQVPQPAGAQDAVTLLPEGMTESLRKFEELPSVPCGYTVLQFQCLRYKTEIVQDLRKIDKFINNLMRHMASREQRSSDAN